MPSPPPAGPGGGTGLDASIEKLGALFREHPAWRDAARRLSNDSASAVYFSHLPDERWQLVQRDDAADLLRGAPSDPDLAFRFTPAAIERLEEVRGGMGDFAVVLFELMAEEEVSLHVGFRVVAPFGRLLRRGYVRLLLGAGPKVVAFAAGRGVRSIGEVRRLIRESQAGGPASWENP